MDDPSPSPTVTNEKPPAPSEMGTLRKYTLLSMFCTAQFLDTFNVSSVYSAIPTLEALLGITSNESPWIIAAFQLTFAAFLLMSGKISDIYNPRHCFIVGIGGLGIVCLIIGFVKEKIAHFVLRAIAGVFGALTIPSALTLIVQIFPEPKKQATAFLIFGGSAAFGNTLGLVIGAIFVQYATWSWVFWFPTCVAVSIAVVSFFIIPEPAPKEVYTGKASKLRRLDIPGVTWLTVAIILLIYALTTAPADGWGSAGVIAPLVISIVMIVAFFFWEKRLPIDEAAIPARTWFLPNFSILFAVALLPFFWWTNAATLMIPLYQDGYHWSAINAAVHMIPIGISSGFFAVTGWVLKYLSSKQVLFIAHIMLVVATILLALSEDRTKYWPYTFPGFIIGSGACMVIYTHTNIAIFRPVPPSMAGTVGAIFNSALQLGSAVGIAIAGSIQNGINGDNSTGWAGKKAAYWFTLAVVGVETIALVVFMHTDVVAPKDPMAPSKEGSQVSSQNGDEGGERGSAEKGDATAAA